MSITSTRKVSASTSYRSSSPRQYETALGGQSFIETIDTTNNVLIKDEQQSNHGQFFDQKKMSQDENPQTEDVLPVSEGLRSSSQAAPLLDNDDITEDATYLHKNVGIYGANQEISNPKEERINNPYFKHFYENNEVIEDIDEFV